MEYTEKLTNIAPGHARLHVRHVGYFYRDIRGFHALMANGTVRLLPADIAPQTFRDMLAVDRAANVDVRAIDGKRLNWSHIIALTTLVGSFLLLLLRPRRAVQPSRQSVS